MIKSVWPLHFGWGKDSALDCWEGVGENADMTAYLLGLPAFDAFLLAVALKFGQQLLAGANAVSASFLKKLRQHANRSKVMVVA